MRTRCTYCSICGGLASFRFTKHKRDIFLCSCCGLYFTNCLPSLEEIAKLYGPEYYDSWGLQRDKDSLKLMKQATFLDRIEKGEKFVLDKGRILDIGCATGFFLNLAQDRGWDPYGVELSPYSSELARQLIGNDRIFTGQLVDAGFCENSFNAVFITDVIEHVLDLQPFLEEVTRITRPGGIVAITTPNAGSLSCQLMGKHWYHFKAEHIRYFTKKSLELLMQPLGFTEQYTESAYKTLNFAYIELQLRTHFTPFVTPLVGMIANLLPNAMLRHLFNVPSIELFQIYTKNKRIAT